MGVHAGSQQAMLRKRKPGTRGRRAMQVLCKKSRWPLRTAAALDVSSHLQAVHAVHGSGACQAAEPIAQPQVEVLNVGTKIVHYLIVSVTATRRSHAQFFRMPYRFLYFGYGGSCVLSSASEEQMVPRYIHDSSSHLLTTTPQRLVRFLVMGIWLHPTLQMAPDTSKTS